MLLDFSYQLFQNNLLKRLILYTLYCLKAFIQTQWTLYMRVYFWFSILFHWYIYLSLCQFHTVLVISFYIKYWKFSKWFLLFQNCFSYPRIFVLPYKFLESAFTFLRRTCWHFNWNDTECIHQLGVNWWLINVESSKPQTKYISPFI